MATFFLQIIYKRENEALWKEIASLRQKHHHQQQIVNKLIHFLVHLVNPSSLGLKRTRPLMIDSHSANSLIDDNQDHIFNETDDEEENSDDLIIGNKRRKKNFIVLNENNEEINNNNNDEELDETELIQDKAKRKRANLYDGELETINIRKTKNDFIDKKSGQHENEDDVSVSSSTNTMSINPLKKFKNISASDQSSLITQKIQGNSLFANKNNFSIYDIKVFVILCYLYCKK